MGRCRVGLTQDVALGTSSAPFAQIIVTEIFASIVGLINIHGALIAWSLSIGGLVADALAHRVPIETRHFKYFASRCVDFYCVVSECFQICFEQLLFLVRHLLLLFLFLQFLLEWSDTVVLLYDSPLRFHVTLTTLELGKLAVGSQMIFQ